MLAPCIMPADRMATCLIAVNLDEAAFIRSTIAAWRVMSCDPGLL